MSLKDKIYALDLDSAYNNLIDRFESETEAILAGAGDEESWRIAFYQLRDYEREYFGL